MTHLGYRGPWDLRDLLEGVIVRERGGGEETGRKGVEVEEIEETTGKERVGGIPGGRLTDGVEAAVLLGDERVLSTGSSPSSKYPPLGQWRILDLGCGSGLVGKVFYDLVFQDSIGAQERKEGGRGHSQELCTAETVANKAGAGGEGGVGGGGEGGGGRGEGGGGGGEEGEQG